MREAVTRVNLHNPDIRIYFDVDEQVVSLKLRCKDCGAWWNDGEQHIPPCTTESHMAKTLERIRRNIDALQV